MLYFEAQLSEDLIGYIRGVLGYKIDAHTFGAYELYNTFDLVKQGIGGFLEDQVCLIYEQYQFRLLG